MIFFLISVFLIKEDIVQHKIKVNKMLINGSDATKMFTIAQQFLEAGGQIKVDLESEKNQNVSQLEKYEIVYGNYRKFANPDRVVKWYFKEP